MSCAAARAALRCRPSFRRGAASGRNGGAVFCHDRSCIVLNCRRFSQSAAVSAAPAEKDRTVRLSKKAHASRSVREEECSYNVPYARRQPRRQPRRGCPPSGGRLPVAPVSHVPVSHVPIGDTGLHPRRRRPTFRASVRAPSAPGPPHTGKVPAAGEGRSGRPRRGAGVVERGGLENRCALCVPWVRIPPSPPDGHSPAAPNLKEINGLRGRKPTFSANFDRDRGSK